MQTKFGQKQWQNAQKVTKKKTLNSLVNKDRYTDLSK